MTKTIEITAPAKINFCLDILKKDSSGYHEIRTIYFAHENLKDILEIFETKDSDHTSIAHTSQNGLIKTVEMEENLAHKALLLFKKTFKITKNAHIKISKKIPISAGLGGASTDAAAVLKGLNRLWELNLTTKDLLPLAETLGADVPFFLYLDETNVALGTHFGEKITPLPRINSLKFEIKILPTTKWATLPITDMDYKTGQMYESLDLAKCGHNAKKTDQALKFIKNSASDRQNSATAHVSDSASLVDALSPLLHNDFETLIAFPSIHTATPPHHSLPPDSLSPDSLSPHSLSPDSLSPDLRKIHLSGSGPACFSLCR